MAVSASEILQDKALPEIYYNRKELDEIIDELKVASEVKKTITECLDSIEEKVKALHKYRDKSKPENFYQAMRTTILDIKNIANSLYELTKYYHEALPNTLKNLILKWVTPLEKELNRRSEMPVLERNALILKTKQLYAEQSLVSRQLTPALMQHLGKVKKLLSESLRAPYCYISYAWPSKEFQDQEYWVQPFLTLLYDHLTAAGIRVVMDIRDNQPGDSIYQFMKRYHEGNYIILVGTESLLQKHYNIAAHAVQTELSIISTRFEQDQRQFGRSRIYPMLISGTIQSAYPEIYDKYRTIRDAREPGYLGTLKKLIDWMYQVQISQKSSEYSALWKSFYQHSLELPKDPAAIEEELRLGFHRQRLDFLRQDLQYQSVEAQEKTQRSQAVTVEIIGAQMQSQGISPKTLFDENGQQFQRPPINPDFIERPHLWEKILKHFAKSHQQILTLTAYGLGGIGKTELAQYYYQHPPRPYTLRAWFYAETKQRLYQQYLALAEKNGIQFLKETPIEKQVRRVKKWLESQKNCLLIYDNVPNLKEIEELLPQQGKHHILITSRNEVDWPQHQKLDVDVMEEGEAVELMVKITSSHDNSALKELANTLGRLPLALAQAGAYILVKSLSIKEYLAFYQDYQAKVLTAKTPRSPKHEPVWITFDISFCALGKDCPLALETLKQAAWLSSAAIPEGLLFSMIKNNPGMSNQDKRLIWGDIKEQLKRYSLMRINIEQAQFNMHPLLQDILRSQQNMLESIERFKEVCDSLDALFSSYKKEGLSYRTLLPHAERLQKYSQKIAEIARIQGIKNNELLSLEPWCLEHMYLNLGLTRQALIFLKKKEKIVESHYGKSQIEIANVLMNLGNVYSTLGKFAKAKQYLEQALRVEEDHYGKDHIETANTLMNLGTVYSKLGNLPEASQYLERALKIQESYYGKDHIETANTLMNLGNVYLKLGKCLDARQYYERVLKSQESHYGKDRIETANTLMNLGNIYSDLGKLSEARQYHEQALKMKENYYGKDHIETASALMNLGNVYSKLGKLWDAQQYLGRALMVKENHYGKDHIETANTLMNLGNVYAKLGKLSEASQYHERALKSQESYYGKDHIETANALINLGNIYSALGKLLDAQQYLERALKMKESHYGKDHINTASALVNLGNVYSDLEKLLEAQQYYERALEIQENYYGKDHIETASTLENIGLLYKQLKEFQKAIEYLQQAQKIYCKNFPANHPDILKIEQVLKAILDDERRPYSTPRCRL